MQEELKIIPMSGIRDEARQIAVLWHESATNWIGDKHKLASDIQNYADKYAREQNSELYEALQKVYRLAKQIGLAEDLDFEEFDYIGAAINKALTD